MTTTEAPHWLQKRLPSGVDAWQLGQIIGRGPSGDCTEETAADREMLRRQQLLPPESEPPESLLLPESQPLPLSDELLSALHPPLSEEPPHQLLPESLALLVLALSEPPPHPQSQPPEPASLAGASAFVGEVSSPDVPTLGETAASPEASAVAGVASLPDAPGDAGGSIHPLNDQPLLVEPSLSTNVLTHGSRISGAHSALQPPNRPPNESRMRW